MPYGDGIDRINCFSLTDFHDFDFCPFRFFVKHHLNKKYEIEEGNVQMALGSLLDQSIKYFHRAKAYGQPSGYLINIIRAACADMKEKVAKSSGPSFYSNILKFLDEDLIQKANSLFVNYYEIRDRKINRSLGAVGFCEWVAEDGDNKFKLWGGPDAYELGDDGMPEVVDYKSREDIEKGKSGIDMDIMPKIYVLLSAKTLMKMGYKKARFRVRFWQDPKDESFYEEFNLEELKGLEVLFKQKIQKILAVTKIDFCEKEFCRACKSDKRGEYLSALDGAGYT